MTALRPPQPLPHPDVSTILEAMSKDRTAGQPAANKPVPDDVRSLHSVDDTATEEGLIDRTITVLSPLQAHILFPPPHRGQIVS